MLIACSQLGWPDNITEEEILTGIAHAGYAGALALPRQGRTADEVVRLFASHWLFPAPGELMADLWRPEQQGQILESVRRLARFARDVGCTELSLLAGGYQGYGGLRGKRRCDVVGRVTREDGLNAVEWRRLLDTLHRAGEIALREGVSTCLRNHVGSVVESAEEIERLLSAADPALVHLAVDSGHLAWAGMDPPEVCRSYAARIKMVYLSDIHPEVLQFGLARGWNYDGFVSNGLFAQLGGGCVDFPALFDVLRLAGFAGWAVVGGEGAPEGQALERAASSREYLRRIGLS